MGCCRKPDSAALKPDRQPAVYERPLFLAGTIFLIALAVRVPLLFQSLWYDELVTLIQYVWQPWSRIVSGQYSPNNHILFSLIAKAFDQLAGGDATGLMARLPSLLAGAGVGIVLAMPLRRRRAWLAAALALLISLNPWLIAFSGWARGYAMLLLLAVISTLSLAQGRPVAYAVSLVAALYTHPIAIALVPGHAAVVAMRASKLSWRQWLVSIAAAGAITALLYLPFVMGARQYWSAPERPSMTYAQFVADSLRSVHAGQGIGGAGSAIVSLLACTAGVVLAWRWTEVRAYSLTFGIAAAFGLLVPLVIRTAGETRAMLWLVPLYGIGMLGLLTSVDVAGWRWLGIAAAAILLAFMSLRIAFVLRTPAQPIADAVEIAQIQAKKTGQSVIGVYMAASEARVYGGIDLLAYTLEPGGPEGWPSLKEAEAKTAGRRPIVVVFYEDFLRRDQPQLDRYIQEHYQVLQRLPGRISPAVIYQRKL